MVRLHDPNTILLYGIVSDNQRLRRRLVNTPTPTQKSSRSSCLAELKRGIPTLKRLL